MDNDLISRSGLLEKSFEVKGYFSHLVSAWDIAQAPAVDALRVPCRCKDCAVPHNRMTGCPKMNGTIMPPDGFCSYGFREEKIK